MAQRGGRRPAKYREIAGDLRARIEQGEWSVDEQMPTMEQLGERYDVAPGTVDKALGVLRDLGLVDTIQGMGTFVRKPPPPAEDLAAQVGRISERMQLLEKRVAELEGGRHEP